MAIRVYIVEIQNGMVRLKSLQAFEIREYGWIQAHLLTQANISGGELYLKIEQSRCAGIKLGILFHERVWVVSVLYYKYRQCVQYNVKKLILFLVIKLTHFFSLLFLKYM